MASSSPAKKVISGRLYSASFFFLFFFVISTIVLLVFVRVRVTVKCVFFLAVEILGFGSDCERLGADGGGDRHRCSAASWS